MHVATRPEAAITAARRADADADADADEDASVDVDTDSNSPSSDSCDTGDSARDTEDCVSILIVRGHLFFYASKKSHFPPNVSMLDTASAAGYTAYALLCRRSNGLCLYGSFGTHEQLLAWTADLERTTGRWREIDLEVRWDRPRLSKYQVAEYVVGAFEHRLYAIMEWRTADASDADAVGLLNLVVRAVRAVLRDGLGPAANHILFASRTPLLFSGTDSVISIGDEVRIMTCSHFDCCTLDNPRRCRRHHWQQQQSAPETRAFRNIYQLVWPDIYFSTTAAMMAVLNLAMLQLAADVAASSGVFVNLPPDLTVHAGYPVAATACHTGPGGGGGDADTPGALAAYRSLFMDSGACRDLTCSDQQTGEREHGRDRAPAVQLWTPRQQQQQQQHWTQPCLDSRHINANYGVCTLGARVTGSTVRLQRFALHSRSTACDSPADFLVTYPRRPTALLVTSDVVRNLCSEFLTDRGRSRSVNGLPKRYPKPTVRNASVKGLHQRTCTRAPSTLPHDQWTACSRTAWADDVHRLVQPSSKIVAMAAEAAARLHNGTDWNMMVVRDAAKHCGDRSIIMAGPLRGTFVGTSVNPYADSRAETVRVCHAGYAHAAGSSVGFYYITHGQRRILARCLRVSRARGVLQFSDHFWAGSDSGTDGDGDVGGAGGRRLFPCMYQYTDLGQPSDFADRDSAAGVSVCTVAPRLFRGLQSRSV